MTLPPTTPQTLIHLIAHFTAFLTVAIHTILYERHIYPPTTFLSARKYNFPVRQSRHPKVCQWITDAVSAVSDQLLKGTLARVALVIVDPETYKPLERFVWDLTRLPVVPMGEVGTPLEREGGGAIGGQDGTTPPVDLEEQFRAVMSQLSVVGGRLAPIPEGCTFTVSIELKDEADPPIGHPQPWVPSQPGLQRTAGRQMNGQPSYSEEQKAPPEQEQEQGSERREGADLGGVRALPVRTVEAGEMVFEMWIEEGKAKAETMQSSRADSSSFE